MFFILLYWTLMVLGVIGIIVGICLTALVEIDYITLVCLCVAMFFLSLVCFLLEKREYERDHPKFDKYDYETLCSGQYMSGYSAGYRMGRSDAESRLKVSKPDRQEQLEIQHEMYMQGRFDAIAELKHGTPEEHDD